MSKASLFSIGIAVTFSCSSVALASEQTDPWSGLYGGLTYSSSKIDATGTKSGSASYSVDADNDNTNVGLFVGYNYNLSPVIIGLEVGLQDKLAEDPSVPDLVGKVTYDSLIEYKIKAGYPMDQILPYAFYGGGSMKIAWSAYNTSQSYSGYRTMGVGVDYLLNQNVILGFEYAKSSVDIIYSDQNSLGYIDDTDLTAMRIRIGYHLPPFF